MGDPHVEGQVNVELWLADPAFDEIRGLWSHFTGKNWKVTLVRRKLPRTGEKRNRVPGSPQVDLGRKVIEIEMPSGLDEPLPLTLAGDILRLQSLRLFEANDYKLFARVRALTAEAQASDDDLRCLFKFLVERDVRRGKWRIFQKLQSANPELLTEFWESIQLAPDPLSKFTVVMRAGFKRPRPLKVQLAFLTRRGNRLWLNITGPWSSAFGRNERC